MILHRNGLLVFIEIDVKGIGVAQLIYGCDAVLHKLNNRQKRNFLVFSGYFWAYVGQPQDHIGRLSHINTFCIIWWAKDQSMNISWKNIKNWQSWKMSSLSQPFWFFFCFTLTSAILLLLLLFLLYLNEKKQPIHMRYHLFLHYGRFLQNVGKGCVRTNMHTTVCIYLNSSCGYPTVIMFFKTFYIQYFLSLGRYSKNWGFFAKKNHA